MAVAAFPIPAGSGTGSEPALLARDDLHVEVHELGVIHHMQVSDEALREGR